jgi:hypothetical protein
LYSIAQLGGAFLIDELVGRMAGRFFPASILIRKMPVIEHRGVGIVPLVVTMAMREKTRAKKTLTHKLNQYMSDRMLGPLHCPATVIHT